MDVSWRFRISHFWVKICTLLHEDLEKGYNEVMKNPQSCPAWLTKGITYLLPKSEDTKHPQNYRPITCLPTMYEILTSIVAEQKGCWRESYGGRDQLLINKMVVEEVKLRKKNLSMAWIDYRKAFDSVPYSWIEKTLAQPSQGSLQRISNLGKQPYNSTTPEGQSYPGR